MHQIDEALDHEIAELDRVLLRLTTLRLLMVAGKHHLVDRALVELEESMSGFESAERRAQDVLQAYGFDSLHQVSETLPAADRAVLEQRGARLRSLHREVRVCLASTGSAAERSVRTASAQLADTATPSSPTLSVPTLSTPTRRNPFVTGD